MKNKSNIMISVVWWFVYSIKWGHYNTLRLICWSVQCNGVRESEFD